MLKNELPFSWSLALSVTFGLFWRWWLICFIPSMVIDSVFFGAPVFQLIAQIVIAFFGLIIAVKWLFNSGRLSSMKVTFMEQAHYQELASNKWVVRDRVPLRSTCPTP